MFCQLEVLRHCIPASIRKTLDQLPKSLDDTYLRVLRQIPQANQAHAHRMLQCLVVAVRPLEVVELAELLAFEFDGAQGGIPKYCPALRLDDQTQAVLSTCSSLVTIVKERSPDLGPDRQVVQFSHFSVKEFLVSNRLAPSLGDISQYNIRLGSAHVTLTQACLGLLLHSDDSITVERSPLAIYAARHWVEHAQFEDVASHVKDGMETLFDADKPHFKAWVGINNIDPRVSGRDMSEDQSPLYFSALCGFYGLVEHLTITHPEYINAIGGQYQFPLLAALGEGHVEVAELLLKHGADLDVRDATGKTMLHIAIEWFEVYDILSDMLEFLLTHGADVNARDDTFNGSLHVAEDFILRRPLVTRLLKHGVDVNSQNKDGKTPLHVLLEAWILDEEDEDDALNHARLLLEHGAEVNIRDKDNQTPLLVAMELNWFEAARILIEHGADANTKNKSGKTLLHMLLSVSNIDDALDHMRLLLKHGAEVNKGDNNNLTPLHLAILRNQFSLAGILLEHGADANAESDIGCTPLHILSESDIKDERHILNLVQLLLKHGGEVNKGDNNNHTPLHLAIQWNQFSLAGILLEHGADANAENNLGITPLHFLSASDNKDEGSVLSLILLLLKHGAEVNKGDHNNHTPLHLAIQWNQFSLAGILLEHGADANAESDIGRTPFHMLSESDIKDESHILNLVQLLLKHGGEVNKGNNDNLTPLHLAILRNQFSLAGILLEHGADANAENNLVITPLHFLSASNSKDEGNILNLMHLLLKHGAEVNRGDNINYTPLHLAILRNQSKLVAILLEHGADSNAENDKGQTSLHILSESNIKDEADVLYLALLLLKHGAEVNSRDKHNKTPLHLAIPRNWFELAGILLEHGADTDAQNNRGKTPLCTLMENWSYDKGDLINHRDIQQLVYGNPVNRHQEGNKILLLPVIGEGKQRSLKLLLSLAAQILLWRTTKPISWCNKYHGGTTAPGIVGLVLPFNHSNMTWTSKRKMRIKMRTK